MKIYSSEEKRFIIDCVEKEKLHPKDIVPLLPPKFGHARTLGALTKILSTWGISFIDCLPSGIKKETKSIIVTAQSEPLSEEEMRDELSKKGYKIEKTEGIESDRRVRVDTSMFEGDKIKFAVLSCSQLGSKYQQLTYLKRFYAYAQDKGVKVFLHCGDMIDGEKMYRGHEYELFIHGATAQKDYAIEQYPEVENGGKTYVIMGQHDECYWKQNGINVLAEIAQERDDIVYLGRWGAYPKIGDIDIYMAHGVGGVAYARSYKMQKNIEQFSPAQKPDLYFLGHYHVTSALFQYRNVTAFMIPCFQSQTPYLKGKGLYPEIGAFICEITISDAVRKKGIASIRWEFVPFFVPVENDY